MTKTHFRLVGEAVNAEPYPYKGSGLEGIYLLNGYEKERHDDELHVLIRDVEGLHRAIGKHLVLHRKGLAPKEIRFLRNTMDLTQEELAARLGNSTQSVARWEKGECEIPGPEEKLLRAIFLASLVPEDQLRALRDLLNHKLEELDRVDQLCPPKAEFELFDEWTEKEAA
jgi:DNA-binding transcriptional regulator YiaG